MRFPVYFKRIKGAGTLPLLGSDTKPTVASKKLDYTPPTKPGDNILSHKLQRPMNRVAIGWWYEGGGAAPASLPVTIYVWDETSEKWYTASTGTLTNGVITYLKCVSLADPPQIAANLGQPQHGVDVLVIVEDNAGADGTYHFVVGPDTAFA
jgi:hypothetical protein